METIFPQKLINDERLFIIKTMQELIQLRINIVNHLCESKISEAIPAIE